MLVAVAGTMLCVTTKSCKAFVAGKCLQTSSATDALVFTPSARTLGGLTQAYAARWSAASAIATHLSR
jgi:hypothetical protein